MESGVVVLVTHPHPWRPRYSFPSFSLNPLPSSHSRCSFSTRYRRWDSNAETIRSQGFSFGFKPKGDDDEEEEEEDDDDDEDEYEYGGIRGKKRRWWSDKSSKMDDGPFGILEETIDSVWIFRVFRSYGWMLPFIIISLLAATGPKAFLMALALPLGQSALSLAFDKIWGKTERKRKRKFRTRMRRKPSVNNANDVETDEEEDEGQETRKQRTGYQSWVAGGPVDKSSQDGAANFGGWDDLERLKSAQRPSRMKSGLGRRTTEKGKLSRRERKSDTPLLLRLLIAVFPFLGSWTKMLW